MLEGKKCHGEKRFWLIEVVGRLSIRGPLKTGKVFQNFFSPVRLGSARMSISLFGVMSDSNQRGLPSEPPQPPKSDDGDVRAQKVGDGEVVGDELMDPEGDGEGGSEFYPPEGEVSVSAWPPRIVPRSGPAFESLENSQKADLRRIHSNLGHPSPRKIESNVA